MAVPVTLAEWLRSPELVEISENGGIASAWGDLAANSSITSPLAVRSAAADEGARQIGFLGHPLAIETVEIVGRHAKLVGRSRRIQADVSGYASAPSVFIIGADERSGGTTSLTVIRRVEQS